MAFKIWWTTIKVFVLFVLTIFIAGLFLGLAKEYPDILAGLAVMGGILGIILWLTNLVLGEKERGC